MLGSIIKTLSNLPGWRTRRRIVVIESDDWGSIRMPSLAAFEALKAAGVDIARGDNQRFNTLDTLASPEDLKTLFETLRQFRDGNGNTPVFTALALSANPDFSKIKATDFQEYHYEKLPQTLSRYGLEESWSLWQQAYNEEVFCAEFHGREHLNVNVWLKALRANDKATLLAFQKECWGFRPGLPSGVDYQAAFDVDETSILALQKQIIADGINLFEELHQRKPQFFVPPNGAIHQSIIDYSAACGMRFISSPKIHREPLGDRQFKKRFRWLGKQVKNKAIYLTRNCFFEPSYSGKGFAVEDCLEHITTAFKWSKPAVISTHRVNYVGGLQAANRKQGNQELKRLLSAMLQRWPDIEFMTSTQLGELILHDKG